MLISGKDVICVNRRRKYLSIQGDVSENGIRPNFDGSFTPCKPILGLGVHVTTGKKSLRTLEVPFE